MLGLSSHESNHFACQEAGLLTYENLLNKIRIVFALRLTVEPCEFIRKAYSFLSIYSKFYKEMQEILNDKYDIDFLTDNDKVLFRDTSLNQEMLGNRYCHSWEFVPVIGQALL